jgi:decaprenyl-phosphate phosphoribosyltransferase
VVRSVNTPLVAVIRPKQWSKNLLIFAAPIASTELFDNFTLLIVGFIGFTAASIMGYLTNDWLDKEHDRLHEKKQFRPFASGKLQRGHFIFLLTSSSFLTLFTCVYAGSDFSFMIFMYLTITFSYSFFIKNIAVFEMFWLALGFLVRALAGSVLVGIAPTGWFIITIYFGSLFLTSCKRRSEKSRSSSGATRKVLVRYSANFLDSISATFAGVTAITYSLWVIQEHSGSYMAYGSIFPFFCALTSYLLMSTAGEAEEPELSIFTNKLVFSMGLTATGMLVWVFYQ